MSNKKYGLIGCPLGHSHSPKVHSMLGDYEYKLYEISAENLPGFLKDCPLDGFNVTIPYKVAVMDYLDEISDNAKRIGAVNTVVKREDGTLYGDNTDYSGLEYVFDHNDINMEGKEVLIVGSGGASRMACVLCSDKGAKRIYIASRNPEKVKTNDTVDAIVASYEDIPYERIDIIINATPVGMYPNTDKEPVDIDKFANCGAVVDLLYNPLRTRLMQHADEKGITAAGGLGMLIAQAVKASEIFGFTPNGSFEDIVGRIEESLRPSLSNVIFIGMPGCGKSTAAKYCARVSEREVIDTDKLIEEEAGMTIPEIFEKEGESGFRAREAKVISDVSKQSGKIIAVGGGAVLSLENRRAMRQNGFVIYLDTPIDLLGTKGRPLSKSREALEKLKAERSSLYEELADVTVPVTQDFVKSKQKIIEILMDFEKRG